LIEHVLVYKPTRFLYPRGDSTRRPRNGKPNVYILPQHLRAINNSPIHMVLFWHWLQSMVD